VTIVLSAVVSLTLTPMMCSRILRHNPKEQQGRFYKASERVFESMIDFYGRTLTFVLGLPDHHSTDCRGHADSHCRSLYHHPKGFFPIRTRGDSGHFAGIGDHFI